LTSQYFANLYLGLLDRFVKETLGAKGYLRYMDDFILFADSKEILHDWHFEIFEFVRREMILELKQSAIVAPCHRGLSFLGFRIFPNNLRLCGEKWRKFRRKVFAKENAYLTGEITETQMADSVRSMIAHISKADTLAARRKFFANSALLR
jgi:hypothetical protein